MKVLLTGHKGFIGQNMHSQLKRRGWSVSTYDIQDGPKRPHDLSLDGMDWVIHIGAISQTTETNIQKIMDQNLSWSIELLEKCISSKVNFQWASSASVYGKRKMEDGPFKVTDQCYPENPYAYSKFLLEQYITTRRPNIVWQGFRYFNVYGPHEDHKRSQASPYTQFENQALTNGTINVFEGSENFFRDFIHVDEVIKKQLNIMEKPISGLFNVGTGEPKSFMQVAEEIAARHKAKIKVIPFPETLKSHYQTYTCAG